MCSTLLFYFFYLVSTNDSCSIGKYNPEVDSSVESNCLFFQHLETLRFSKICAEVIYQTKNNFVPSFSSQLAGGSALLLLSYVAVGLLKNFCHLAPHMDLSKIMHATKSEQDSLISHLPESKLNRISFYCYSYRKGYLFPQLCFDKPHYHSPFYTLMFSLNK